MLIRKAARAADVSFIDYSRYSLVCHDRARTYVRGSIFTAPSSPVCGVSLLLPGF